MSSIEEGRPPWEPIRRKDIPQITREELSHVHAGTLILIESFTSASLQYLTGQVNEANKIITDNSLARLRHEKYDPSITDSFPMVIVLGDKWHLEPKQRKQIDDARILMMTSERWQDVEKEIYRIGPATWPSKIPEQRSKI